MLYSFLYSIVRPILFLLPAETSHDLGLKALRLLHSIGLVALLKPSIPAVPTRVFGLEFSNPVGLAAGLDKNADYLDALGALGFGFVEVGTVTPLKQYGNPKPRVFRLVEDDALINRLGFNNFGAKNIAERIRSNKQIGLLGINIGPNKDTKNRLNDYIECLKYLFQQ